MAGTVDSWAALGSAIYSRLAAPLGSALFDGIAPQGQSPPYTIWELITSEDDYAFNADHSEDVFVRLRVVSNRNWPGEARRVYGTAHAFFEDAPLNVSGFTVHRVRRTDKFQFMDREMFWNVGGDYRVSLEKT